MTSFRLLSLEKAAACAALAALIGAAGWTWREQGPLRRLQAGPAAADWAGAVYMPAALPELPADDREWTRPAAQSAGGEWVYELFTPPVIYYQATAHAFTVTPPVDPAEKPRSPFGLELLAVRREPFRLQLVGYVGAPGGYTAAFVSAETTQTLLARPGQRFDQLGLVLKAFELRRVSVGASASDAGPVATLHDERSGAEVTLDARGPALTDTPLAVLRVGAGTTAKPRVVRQGDVLRQDDAIFRVERIQLDPPEVVVARQARGQSHPETRVLRPEAAGKSAASAAAAARRLDPLAAESGLARSERQL